MTFVFYSGDNFSKEGPIGKNASDESVLFKFLKSFERVNNYSGKMPDETVDGLGIEFSDTENISYDSEDLFNFYEIESNDGTYRYSLRVECDPEYPIGEKNVNVKRVDCIYQVNVKGEMKAERDFSWSEKNGFTSMNSKTKKRMKQTIYEYHGVY